MLDTILATSTVAASLGDILRDMYSLLITDQLLDYLPRILLATVLGALIGFERRYRHKSAGVRTHLLIAASAALITLCGEVMTAGIAQGDPTRLAHAILAGIGFVGAGVILKRGISTQGVTTAATILLSAAVGIACGFGMFALATASTILMIFALSLTTKYLTNTERCYPLKVVCREDQLHAVRSLFGRHSLMGGFDKNEDNVEFTIQPELTFREYDALVPRLIQNPAVISVEPLQENEH